jgi:hypothetical protein
MGLRMTLGENQLRASQVQQMAASLAGAAQRFSAAITCFDGEENLAGEAYDAARQYFRSGYGEAASGLAALAELLADAAQQFPDGYVANVGGQDLDEDDLNTQAQTDDANVADMRANARELKRDPSTAGLGKLVDQSADDLAVSAGDLRSLVQKMHAYDGTSAGLLADYGPPAAQVKALIDQVAANAAVPAGTPVDVSTLAPFDWSATLLPYQVTMVQSGLDEQSAQTIEQIDDALRARFPDMSDQDRAYLLNRILSEMNPGYVGGEWDDTAGSPGDYFYDEVPGPHGERIKQPWSLDKIMSSLGISDGDYQHLSFEISQQHKLCNTTDTPEKLFGGSQEEIAYRQAKKADMEQQLGHPLTDQEFHDLWMSEYERFHGKADFAHQAFTAATILAPSALRLSSVYAWWQNTTRDELAGWVGDDTTKAGKQPSMDDDDYKADLDAANIAYMIQQTGDNYTTAAQQYYADLAAGKYTRATKFLEHTSLDEVKHQVTIVPPWGAAPSINPVAQRFLDSLEAGSNDLIG